MHTETFDPIDYGFRFVGDWYEYDGKAAERAALKARNDYAKAQRALGKTVKCSAERNNLRSMGGIGSGHPHIELVVPIYTALVIG